MDGFEATQIIRQIEVKEKRAFRIPIIALTASVVDDDIQKCFDVGMDDYVPKPFKAGLLKEKLDKAIGLRVSNTTPAEPHQENTTPIKLMNYLQVLSNQKQR
nr:response regulator [Vibrio alginolyticus]